MMKKCHFFIYLNLLLFPVVLGFSKKIKLGGLFEENDESQQAFVLSMNAANKLRRTTNELANVHLVPHIELIKQDAFEIAQNACTILGQGVAAIFGPSDRVSREYVQSMCETVEIPNIVARWDIEPVRMKAFNFYPHAQTLAMVLIQMITDMRWKSCTILYDNTDGLLRTNQLLKRWDPDEHSVTIRHLGNGPDYRDILSKVQESQEENIVIDCSYDIMEKVLRQSQQVGLFTDSHRVIVNNLDLHTIDLEPYEYSGAIFIGIRLVHVENYEAQNIFNTFLLEMGFDSLSKLRVESALMYDAVQFFARALKRAKDVKEGNVKSLACDGSESWDYGTSLTNYMRTTEFRGLTGLVKFDTNGFRTDFELDIVKLERKGLMKVGTYNSTSGIDWRIDGKPVRPVDDDDLQNETFTVLIALSPPYNMVKESSTLKTGNDRYEGYAIDIIHELSKILHFNYTFVESDSDYGSIEDGKMTGMLGAIVDGEADLAITDLTITSERESAVDFTMPFMNLGISILYRRPTKAAPSMFSFLLPFTHEVWVHVLAVYIFCSVMICIVARMSIADWKAPLSNENESNELENQWTLKEGFWFMLGALMLQGSDVIPSGHSTRMMAIALSFFRLIVMNTYTANLASFMVVPTVVKPIKSAEDLANLDGAIKYGAKDGGSTYNFFRDSNYSTYSKMYKYMKANADDVLTDDNDEGLRKVLDPNQNYAFLMESSSIHYIRHRKCNVTQIGGLLDAKGYGIAMQKNAAYRNKFNTAVLHLQETGVLAQLQIKWWEEKRGGGDCDVNKGESTVAAPLTMEHVNGVFVISIIGVVLAAVWVLFEFLWEIKQTSSQQNLSFMDEFMEEMRFIMKCRGSVKQARRRGSSSQMTEINTRDNTPPYGFVPKIITTVELDK